MCTCVLYSVCCTYCAYMCTVQCVLYILCVHVYCTVCVAVHTVCTCILYSVCCTYCVYMCTACIVCVVHTYCVYMCTVQCVLYILCVHVYCTYCVYMCTVQCVVHTYIRTYCVYMCTVQCVLLYYSAHICPTGVLCPPDTKVLLGSVRRDVLTKMVRSHMKPVRDHKRRILANTTGCVHNKCSYVPPEIMHTYSTCMSTYIHVCMYCLYVYVQFIHICTVYRCMYCLYTYLLFICVFTVYRCMYCL